MSTNGSTHIGKKGGVHSNEHTQRKGFTSALFAQIIWGVLVLYWKAAQSVSPYEILSMRVIMSGVTAAIFLLYRKDLINAIKSMKNIKYTGSLFLAGLLIFFNWGIFIYAVNSGFVLECSLAYFLSPIITAACGVLFFKEKPDKYIITSLIIVFLSIVYIVVSYGKFPVITIVLAFSYSAYLTTKKKINADALHGVFLESILVTPIALVWLIIIAVSGASTIPHASIPVLLLLVFSGLVTMVPLLLTMMAQKNISLIIIAIMGYIAPTMQMLIGVFVFKEQFEATNAISLAAVILAVSYFTFGQLRSQKASALSKSEAAQ